MLQVGTLPQLAVIVVSQRHFIYLFRAGFIIPKATYISTLLNPILQCEGMDVAPPRLPRDLTL